MASRGPKKQKNMFGLILSSYFHGDKTPYSVVRDDGHVEYPNDPTEYLSVEDWYLKNVEGKVLDVGCGSGSYLLSFQKKGLDVYGIDIDELCIRLCKERGLKNVWNENILKPGQTKKHRFDTIVLAGNNLGIAGSLENIEKMLRYFNVITTDAGTVIGEGLNFTKTTSPIHKKYAALQRSKGRFAGVMTMRLDYKDMVGEWFDWIHTPEKELKVIAKKTGWKVESAQKKDGIHYRFILKKIA